MMSPRESFFLEGLEHFDISDDFSISDDIFEDLKSLIARYSAGISLEKFDEYFMQIFEHDYKNTKWYLDNIDDYYFAMTLVSLFRLRAKSENLKRLGKLVPYKEDRMLCFIAEDSDEVDYTKPIFNLDPYIYLHNFAVDQKHNTANLETFLEQFYFAFKGKSWFESHQSKSEQFFGYWTFGLAAMVKKYNSSDIFFIDNLYYPRDLVNRIFMPTWQDSDKGLWARAQKKSIQRLYENKLKNQKTSKEYYLSTLFKEKFQLEFLKVNQDKLRQIFFKAFKQIAENEEKETIISNNKLLKLAIRTVAEDILNIDLGKISQKEGFFRQDIARKVYLDIMKMPDISYQKEVQYIEKLSAQDHLMSIERETLFLFFDFAKEILLLDKKYDHDDTSYWQELDDLVKGNKLEELFKL